jgi:hypothetical protein
MKKFIKRASRKPVGRNPVVSIRVSAPTYDLIRRIADRHQQSISEAMSGLLEQALRWDVELETKLRAQGFQRLHGTPHWVVPQGAQGGFIEPTPEAEEAFLHPAASAPPVTETEAHQQLDQIDAELDRIEKAVRALRAGRSKKEAT